MNQNRNLAKATFQGTMWEYTSQYTGRFLVFISTAILARLLIKEDFGIAGYALVVIGFLEIVEGLGIGSAIIYHHEDKDRLNTAFWIGVGMGLSLFVLSFFVVAPLAGQFFQDARAVPVTQALALVFPLSSLGLVPRALLMKKLAFGRKFVPEMSRSLSKGIVSVVLALLGFGAWSLIIGQIAGTAVETLAYWWVVPWRPQFRFHRHLATSLLSYGTGVISMEGLGIVMLNLDYLLIGRYMSAAALGTYTLAFRVPELLVKQFCNVVGNVTFPIYSRLRDDPQALKRGFLKTMRYMTMLTIPMGLGLALVSRPFVLTFFTAKWADAIPVMSAIALYTLFRSLVFNAGSVYKATGRPGLLSRLSLIQAAITIPALWWAVVTYNTILAVAWMQVALALFFGLVKLVMAGHLVNIPLHELAQTFYPSLFAGGLMALAVWLASQWLINFPPLLELLGEVAVGGLVYTLVIWLTQREDIVQASLLIRSVLRRQGIAGKNEVRPQAGEMQNL
ncbi:MAG: lipopolysaccharide biosynthesis protein [Chloroflexi bacterium]|nr:lipopolysaccharide biosynthesis protein [Chloroflexota bacterium]MBP8055665.1 lipopolysaccharide biosynthesis protein [Chloroflexota bacterium]